ncbi:TetR family transcriptional regulator [Mycolicibacterium sp. CBMA 361]|uniref:TetR family transcriptional regulator n=1 Tax=Mycolicibacterium sp. CBMA 361 TaxID=2606610 RepID=UPI0012DDA254|nr:TetR family transcriptional regulator [Mycolicibacterium sp. CBMA 361]MUM30689.1 TetR family transcriptional regulator [Mycolicibacterium sp. CBMA 361]
MRLFSEQGYKATSITQIEKAAGLVPGCGALYNHMRDISALFAGEGELRTELTLLGRYLLSVLNQESQFLQVAARTPTDQSDRLNDAYAALVDGLYTELSDWIRGCAPALESAEARRIAVVGVNALLGKQATRVVFHAPQADTPDEEFIADWTAMLAGWIEAAR